MKKIKDNSIDIIDKIKRNGSVEQLSKEESIKINSRIYEGMKAVKRKYVKKGVYPLTGWWNDYKWRKK